MFISYWGGVWLVAVLESTFVHILGGVGVFSNVCKSSAVALVFGMDSCQTFVILNHCVKHGFLVCTSFSVGVGGIELYLQIS